MSTLEAVRNARRFAGEDPPVRWHRRGVVAAGMMLTIAVIAGLGGAHLLESGNPEDCGSLLFSGG